MKKFIILVIFFTYCASVHAQIKVACIGNSITSGYGVKRFQNYPSQLDSILRRAWQVKNFGVSGTTMIRAVNEAYGKRREYDSAKSFLPDAVIIELGTNDSKESAWKYKDAFKTDCELLIKELQSLPSRPVVFICLPMPAFTGNFEIRDSVISHAIIPMIRSVAKRKNVKLINLNKSFRRYSEWFPDGIHPNAKGYEVMAGIISKNLMKYKKRIEKRKI